MLFTLLSMFTVHNTQNTDTQSVNHSARTRHDGNAIRLPSLYYTETQVGIFFRKCVEPNSVRWCVGWQIVFFFVSCCTRALERCRCYHFPESIFHRLECPGTVCVCVFLFLRQRKRQRIRMTRKSSVSSIRDPNEAEGKGKPMSTVGNSRTILEARFYFGTHSRESIQMCVCVSACDWRDEACALKTHLRLLMR